MRELMVNEVYLSVQGESSYVGLPCAFIRLTGCPLRCSYCDTAYSFYQGTRRTIASLVEEVSQFQVPLVEVTGGEPLLQDGVFELMSLLCDQGLKVLLETSGALPTEGVDRRVVKIVDLKCPSSGETHRNRLANLDDLLPQDEVKFVLGTKEDYIWARQQIERYNLPKRCTVLLSCVFGKLAAKDVVEWMLADRLEARFQLQTHKVIWPASARGV